MVDWICTFAYSFVQGIETVALTGIINNNSKVKWRAIFEDRKDFDRAAELAAILAVPDVQL